MAVTAANYVQYSTSRSEYLQGASFEVFQIKEMEFHNKGILNSTSEFSNGEFKWPFKHIVGNIQFLKNFLWSLCGPCYFASYSKILKMRLSMKIICLHYSTKFSTNVDVI
jgi:hypothetical protein